MKKIAVIGSGFAGLATAALLARDGHDVTVYEKNSRLGGRAMTFDAKGFHFDMGPSWYLMPEVFEKYFSLFDRNIHDYVELKPLDPMYRMYFSQKEYVDIVRDLEKNLETFEKLEKGASTNVRKYLENAETQYDIAVNHFLYNHFDHLWDFVKPELFKVGKKANVFTSLDKHISSYTKSDKLKKILGYTMVFLGGSPHNTPALYSLMSHIDYNLGVYYPMGGFGALVDAFVELGKEHGVKYKTSHAIKRIAVKDSYAQSIVTQKGTYNADIVLSNADYHHTETKLLSKEHRSYSPKYWQTRKMAPSAYIIHLGLNKKVKGLKHHTLMLAHDWEKHFNEIFEKPTWPEKPSYYVCCPSKTDASVAPKGKDILFVLVPVASGLRDTEALRKKYYTKIMEDLEDQIGEPIQDSIEYKKIYSHKDFRSDFNALKGTALGLSHTLDQTAIFRPSHRSKKVKNLFYVGQYTQPGIGVPIACISAELVHDTITKKYGK